jgi:hypothetical protein
MSEVAKVILGTDYIYEAASVGDLEAVEILLEHKFPIRTHFGPIFFNCLTEADAIRIFQKYWKSMSQKMIKNQWYHWLERTVQESIPLQRLDLVKAIAEAVPELAFDFLPLACHFGNLKLMEYLFSVRPSLEEYETWHLSAIMRAGLESHQPGVVNFLFDRGFYADLKGYWTPEVTLVAAQEILPRWKALDTHDFLIFIQKMAQKKEITPEQLEILKLAASYYTIQNDEDPERWRLVLVVVTIFRHCPISLLTKEIVELLISLLLEPEVLYSGILALPVVADAKERASRLMELGIFFQETDLVKRVANQLSPHPLLGQPPNQLQTAEAKALIEAWREEESWYRRRHLLTFRYDPSQHRAEGGFYPRQFSEGGSGGATDGDGSANGGAGKE